MPWIYLVLIAVVLVVGLGVLLLNRRRTATPQVPPTPPTPAIDHPPPGPATTLVVEEAPPVEAEVVVEEPAAAEVAAPLERPTFRNRMSKARSALTGALLGVRSRSGITADT